eukprot:1313932-Ditylum_brightwellii.AAC.1
MSKKVFDAEPTPKQLALADANKAYMASASASLSVPKRCNRQTEASSSSDIRLVETYTAIQVHLPKQISRSRPTRERIVKLIEACFQTLSQYTTYKVRTKQQSVIQ